ncbi:MAG: pyruvate, phosphate dikinase [Bacillota bacterium]
MADEPTDRKLVYSFDEGRAEMRGLLGGKGANLAEMTRLGMPVPPGFTITTEACLEYNCSGRIPEELEDQIREKLRHLEQQREAEFGSASNPLLVSVRSGAAISMPGMMDTVLNLGLNDQSVAGLAAITGDERFALDCYRRLIQMFGNVVRGINHVYFEDLLARVKESAGVAGDHELTATDLGRAIDMYLDLYESQTGDAFPRDPWEQLMAAVRAVFASWDNERARVYRRVHGIPDDLGTAVNVQSMVFGNRGEHCGTGVLFTRDPATGEKRLYGEYLRNAQGEDVVAGIRTPRPIEKLGEDLPEVYDDILEAVCVLENHYRDMQDVEFTIEGGQLFLLQTRNGKRTATAAVKIAHDMVLEGLIDRREALSWVNPEDIGVLLHRRIDPGTDIEPLARGLGASPGAARGRVVFTADEAEARGAGGEAVVLIRPETTPDDIHGMVEAQGVLTSRGGLTCHAAIVARGMGKPCVVGCEGLRIDLPNRVARSGARSIGEGDVITIDGSSGRVYVGDVPLIDPTMAPEFEVFLSWADEVRTIGVRANADTPADAERARGFGARGIGLCRTEHMFMQPERLSAMQEMIIAQDREQREKALARLLPMQREDFEGIFRAMDGEPVTIRLLDPPLHEFLPDISHIAAEIAELRARDGSRVEIAEKEEVLQRAQSLQEVNPMLGQRGCRVAVSYPEIYVMQSRAIFEAAAAVMGEGIAVHPEIMIPLISDVTEFDELAPVIRETAAMVREETGVKIPFTVGTMIEVPRACLVADHLAASAEFFSFGTNDLTQTVFGFSRDDAEAKFIHLYLTKGLLEENPFAVLDQRGVGKLMEMALNLGRQARPDLKVGICGEHGGEPESIAFCDRIGLDYVSCSPYRVPVARLAAAQAALRRKE